MAKSTLALPDTLLTLLAQADKQRGFPAGTMASVVQQETGGNTKYLQDPSAYHYGLNAEGKRIAGHTGKVSTAFGPFGILESTGADPGYGVKPLQNKSLEEQVRFASEYLDARSKSAGSLNGGLAGYGEGEKYATQVARRRDGGTPTAQVALAPKAVQVAPVLPVAQDVQVAQGVPPVQNSGAQVVETPMPMVHQGVAPVVVQVFDPQATAAPKPNEAAVVAQVKTPQWDAFQQNMPGNGTPIGMEYGNVPAPVRMVNAAPNFNRFRAWGSKA